ncbi:MAG: hypothetical protein PHV18_08895 [Lachnospiraceae bacterium]|nr:hypothetical protein [Lachnospiraceae bacterium]
MKGRLIAVAGCLVAVGLIFPVWRYMDEKETEGKRNYDIYQQICELEQERDEFNERILQAESGHEEFLGKIKPYEEKLKTVKDVKKKYQKATSIPMTSGSDVFFKVPYALDVEGIVERYSGTKGAVGLNKVAGDFGGPLGKLFGSIVTKGEEDFAEEESTTRIQFSQNMYRLVEPVEKEAEEALLDYWNLAGYRVSLLNTTDEGELLSGVMILEQIGEMTEDEENKIVQTENQAVHSLAKLDFLLNVYYDFSRDSIMEGTQNNLLLAEISATRDTVNRLLGDRDLNGYGYTKEQKKDIVRPLIDEWMQLVNVCISNGSSEFAGGCETLYPDRGWLDLQYQRTAVRDKCYPKRISPHFGNYMGNTPWVFFSNDENSRHRAYFIEDETSKYYYYQTDRGEEVTDYGEDEEGGEARMTEIDYAYEAIIKQSELWRSIAGSYLD